MENNTDLKSIGERIAEQRKLKGLTQKDLAKALHTQREIINYWEKGHRDIKTENIILLAQELGVSADYLLGLAPNPTTDEATKELCKTLGLSEIAIYFLKNKDNQNIRDVINFLFGQHYEFYLKKTNTRNYFKFNEGKFIAPGAYPEIENQTLGSAFRYISIIEEISSLLSLCDLKKEISIEISPSGNVGIISQSQGNINRKVVEESCVEVDASSNVLCEFNRSVSLNQYLGIENIDSIKEELQDIFRQSIEKNIYPDMYDDNKIPKEAEYYLKKQMHASDIIDFEEEENAKKNSKR